MLICCVTDGGVKPQLSPANLNIYILMRAIAEDEAISVFSHLFAQVAYHFLLPVFIHATVKGKKEQISALIIMFLERNVVMGLHNCRHLVDI